MSTDQWIALAINVTTIVILSIRIRADADGKGERRKQLETLVRLGRWAGTVAIAVVSVVMLLGNFVDIAPLLASLGAVGLAVSLGTQTLVKDIVGGLFVLLEGQYNIGDVIQVGDVSGAVERFTLRATYIRDINGKLYIVPNGEVRIVSNVTKDWSRALVDIGVAYEEDMGRVLTVLGEVAERLYQDPDYGSQLLERPQVLGPLTLGDWAITVRTMVKTQAGKQWGVAMELRKRILAACDRERISLPYPRQEVWVHRSPDAGD
jgi:small-conductance mechanosensitive channel